MGCTSSKPTTRERERTSRRRSFTDASESLAETAAQIDLRRTYGLRAEDIAAFLTKVGPLYRPPEALVARATRASADATSKTRFSVDASFSRDRQMNARSSFAEWISSSADAYDAMLTTTRDALGVVAVFKCNATVLTTILNDFDCRIVSYLAESGAMPLVKEMHLNYNSIGDEGCTSLANAMGRGVLPHLEVLNLSCNNIRAAGCTALATAGSSGGLRRLTNLLLSCNSIGDAGCTALAQALRSGALPQLQELRLMGNCIADAGCTALAHAVGSGGVPMLEGLRMFGNDFGDAAKKQLKAACEPRQIDLRCDKPVLIVGPHAGRSAPRVV